MENIFSITVPLFQERGIQVICRGCFGQKEESEKCPDCGYREGDPGKDAEAFAPGTILEGRYLIGNVIHANKTVLTYKAYDRLLDQFVFLRQKRKSTKQNEFLQKARWLAYFKAQDNIIDIYDYWESSDTCFMVLQSFDMAPEDVEISQTVNSKLIAVRKEDILLDTQGKFYITDFDISFPYEKQALDKISEISFDFEDEHCFLAENTLLQRRYQVLKPLGKGGFGVTYLALDQLLDRLVAVKEYMPDEWTIRAEEDDCVEMVSSAVLEDYKKGLQNFQKEAVHMARLNGTDSVAEIYDYFMANETAYIVMEYVDGESIGRLGSLIGGFTYDAAKDIFMKLLEAIQSIHEKGIVHEDISPGNIILNKENKLKIIDFGSAHTQGTGITTISEMMIKPGYAALEQYDEEYTARVETDIYQAAATFYTLITGKKPLEASERWREDTMPLPSELGIEIPEKDESALKQALEILPENRMASAKELWKALQ